MTTSTLSLRHDTAASGPLRTGVALAVTVAVFYSLCTLVWVAAPGPFLGFMNSLFHGMDFSSLVQPAPFAWTGFLAAVTVMSAWAFLAGSFFGCMRELLGR
jgi:hypothetical protein